MPFISSLYAYVILLTQELYLTPSKSPELINSFTLLHLFAANCEYLTATCKILYVYVLTSHSMYTYMYIFLVARNTVFYILLDIKSIILASKGHPSYYQLQKMHHLMGQWLEQRILIFFSSLSDSISLLCD